MAGIAPPGWADRPGLQPGERVQALVAVAAGVAPAVARVLHAAAVVGLAQVALHAGRAAPAPMVLVEVAELEAGAVLVVPQGAAMAAPANDAAGAAVGTADSAAADNAAAALVVVAEAEGRPGVLESAPLRPDVAVASSGRAAGAPRDGAALEQEEAGAAADAIPAEGAPAAMAGTCWGAGVQVRAARAAAAADARAAPAAVGVQIA